MRSYHYGLLGIPEPPRKPSSLERLRGEGNVVRAEHKVSKFLGVPLGRFALNTALFTAGEMALGGESLGRSITKGVVDSLLWETVPGLYLGYVAATGIPQLANAIHEKKVTNARWWNQVHRPSFGGNYRDTRQAMTMRQAAVQAIQGSKLNARSALGGEARLIHRPYQP
jgi:hypothetical protein